MVDASLQYHTENRRETEGIIRTKTQYRPNLIVKNSPKFEYSISSNEEDEKTSTDNECVGPHCILVDKYVDIQS